MNGSITLWYAWNIMVSAGLEYFVAGPLIGFLDIFWYRGVTFGQGLLNRGMRNLIRN
jgi:hypothetical protein